MQLLKKNIHLTVAMNMSWDSVYKKIFPLNIMIHGPVFCLFLIYATKITYVSRIKFLWILSPVTWCILTVPLVFSKAVVSSFIWWRRVFKLCVCFSLWFPKKTQNKCPRTYQIAASYNILYVLGVSLKCPGKVILCWTDRDTSSPYVLISYSFWRFSYSVASYWLLTFSYCFFYSLFNVDIHYKSL